MSLRSEILGATGSLPRFRVLLPTGWQSFRIDDSTANLVGDKAGAVFMRGGRPDLDGQYRANLERAMRDLQAAGGLFLYLPVDTETVQPLSLVVTEISGQSGATLDGWVSDRFREGAEMLDDDGRIVFWRRRKSAGEDGVDQHESFYLTPIPESGRRRALLFSGTGLISSSDDHESEAVVNYSALFDAIVSTITWVKDEDEAAGGINA